MDADDLRKWFRERRELRLGEAMSQYVLNRCQSPTPSGSEVPIMGANARTGQPVFTTVAADAIRAAFPEEFSSSAASA